MVIKTQALSHRRQRGGGKLAKGVSVSSAAVGTAHVQLPRSSSARYSPQQPTRPAVGLHHIRPTAKTTSAVTTRQWNVADRSKHRRLPLHLHSRRQYSRRPAKESGSEGDVIDLGAPRFFRRKKPTLLPRPLPIFPKKKLPKEKPPRRTRKLVRGPPNPRLYRPPPPPLPPPPPPSKPRSFRPSLFAQPLDSASDAALRASFLPTPELKRSCRTARTLLLPPRPKANVETNYHPRSTRLQYLAAMSKQLPPSENLPDGAGPSEYLAELLSALLARRHAEARRWCARVLKLERTPATEDVARQLLLHAPVEEPPSPSLSPPPESPSTSPYESPLSSPLTSPLASSTPDGLDDDGKDSYAGDEESMEMDEEEDEPGSGSWGAIDSYEEGGWSAEVPTSVSNSFTASASTGTPPLDDNGNDIYYSYHTDDEDLENENTTAAASGEPYESTDRKSESVASLQRLRAQFACSIK